MSENEVVKAYYEDFTLSLIRNKIYTNPRHEKIYALFKDAINGRKISSALEIGCGIGMLSEKIRKHIPKVYSVDISENNIKFAKRTVKDVNFIRSDFLKTKLEHKFDLITLFDVLEHFPKELYMRVFEKIFEYSNELTVIMITIPNPQFQDYIREHKPEKLQVVDESIYFNEFLDVLNKFNLEILEYCKYGIAHIDQYCYYLLRYKRDYILQNKPIPSKIRRLPRSTIRRLKFMWRKFKYRKILREFGYK